MKKKYLNHNYYLNVIKKMLNASFVGWVTEKDSKTLLVKVNSKSHPLPLEGGDITEETYRRLILELIGNG